MEPRWIDTVAQTAPTFSLDAAPVGDRVWWRAKVVGQGNGQTRQESPYPDGPRLLQPTIVRPRRAPTTRPGFEPPRKLDDRRRAVRTCVCATDEKEAGILNVADAATA